MNKKPLVMLFFFCLLPRVALASGSSTIGSIFNYLLPYVEFFGFIGLVAIIYYFLTTKLTPAKAYRRANKLFDKALISDEYCAKYSISHEELLKLIGNGTLDAFEGADLLFVEDVSPKISIHIIKNDADQHTS